MSMGAEILREGVNLTVDILAGIATLGLTQEGEIVLDSFAGSDKPAVAARQSGRSYIGIEISDEYARIAQDRLSWEARKVPK